MSEVQVCKDCIHVVGRRTYLEDAKTWKCAHPANVENSREDPVTGSHIKEYILATCYDCRGSEASCGPKGSWFEVYEHKLSQPFVGKVKQTLPSADDLLGELGQ